MKGKYGTRNCDYCGRSFEPIRVDQHLCSMACKDQFFLEERRKALAFWREMQRYQQMILAEEDDAKVA